jgi:hypothetical protein
MNATSHGTRQPDRPALVLLSDRTGSPLWDPALNALIDQLEDRLDSVHVTHAILGGSHPTPADALAAVALMGSSAAVVVVPEGWQAGRVSPWLPRSARGQVPVLVVPCEWDPDSIAAAFAEAGARVMTDPAGTVAGSWTPEADGGRRHTA